MTSGLPAPQNYPAHGPFGTDHPAPSSPDFSVSMEVRLPKLGDTADSGVIVSLLVKAGDTVTAGQTLLELENEKAIAPVPSPAAGTVGEVLVAEGQRVSVGTVLLTLGGAGAAPAAPASPAPAAQPAREPAARPARSVAREAALADDDNDLDDELDTGGPEGPVPAASPYVRKVARDLEISLAKVRGSGRGGRVTLADLARYVARLERQVARAGRHAEEPKGLAFEPVNEDFGRYGPVTSEPFTPLRQVIAARMVENKVTLPHVTQFDEADLSRIETLRARHKAAYEAAGVRLTPTVFILRALVATLRRHPRFNASLNEVTQTLVLKHYWHLGIAVDTEAGLLVPVLRDADKLDLAGLARGLADLALKARERRLSADDMKGGTFTVSNQGAIGGGHFTPVINKPEVAILGLGRTAPRPVVTATGTIEARPMLPIALSYDHRVIDGGSAARFVVDLVRELQEFPEDAVGL